MDIPSTPDDIAARITSLGDQIVAEQRCIAAAEARLARLFAEAAHLSDVTALTITPPGSPPARAQELSRLSLHLELSAMTRVPERTIQHRIAESEVLVEQLPATLAALSAGDLSAAHARVIVDQLIDVDPEDRAEFETRVLSFAATHTASQLKQSARKLREKLHPETIAARHHRAKQDRHVTLTPAPDGMSWLSILTTATIATAAYNRLSALTAATQRRGDSRTRGQLMVDNAHSLLLYGVTASAGPQVVAAAPAPAPAPSDNTDDEVPVWAARSDPARPSAIPRDSAVSPTRGALLQARGVEPAPSTGPVPAVKPATFARPAPVLKPGPPASAVTPASAVKPAPPVKPCLTVEPALTAKALPGSDSRLAAGSVEPAIPLPSLEPRTTTHPLPSIEDVTDGIIPTVHVTVPVLTLLGLVDYPGSLDGYGPIDPETATRLAAHAKSFTRILTHPETGTVLSVSRDRYSPPADMKRALAIRDTHCRAPGCNRLASGCELDHTIPWSGGDETSVENLANLCSKHHHVKHETPWTLEPGPDGALTWTSPSGQVFTTEPDPPDWSPLDPTPGH